MGFEKGKLLKNLLYGLTHPLEMARNKPVLFMLVVGTGVVFLGLARGWWDAGSLRNLLPF